VSETDRTNGSETEVVAVTKHGQTTIPERFREQLGIDPPGKVLFRETDEGTVTIERIAAPNEMRGFAARSEATTETSATELLREKRRQDQVERESHQLS